MRQLVRLVVMTALALFAVAAWGHASEPVTWINLANATVSPDGTTLTKTTGCGGCSDAGGKSQQQIDGDGHVQFVVTDPLKLRYLALSSSQTVLTQLDFAWRIEAGNGEIYENGIYRASTTVTASDTLKIAIESGSARYYKNSIPIYASSATVPQPLFVGAMLMAADSAINNAVVHGTTTHVTWINLANATVSPDGTTLTKTTGCDGCSDAGGKSQQQIDGDGHVQFVVTDPLKLRYLALSSSQTVLTQLDFAWRIEAGNGEIYENGIYRASTTVTASDTLKIAIESGSARYYKNSILIYASSATVPQPLFVGAMLMAAASAINNAVIRGTATSEFTCGLKDDTTVLLPDNYDTFTPPAQGGTYVDSKFNCTVKRLTNGWSQFGGAVRHAYSSMTPFNIDSTRLLLQTATNFFVTDINGTVVVSPSTLAIGTNNEALWSRTNASLIYYHNGSEIKSYNVATGARVSVATLSGYQSLSFGGGEADLSDDGDLVVVVGKKADASEWVFVYQFSTGLSGSSMPIPTNERLDWCDMTASNSYVVCSWNGPGTGRYRGVELYSRNMAFVRQVVPFVGHGDRARDANGDDLVVMEASGDTSPPTGCGGNGIEKIRVSDSQKTCLMATFWQNGTHVSVNGNHGYALMEGMHAGGTASSPAPAGWQSQWGLYYNEIYLAALDASHIWRFAHPRSRFFTNCTTGVCYYAQPRVALSPDGRYLVFDSNFNAQPEFGYTDVYLIKIK